MGLTSFLIKPHLQTLTPINLESNQVMITPRKTITVTEQQDKWIKAQSSDAA